MKVLTIVIPAYNVATYLDECVNSIIGLNEDNRLEIIIINDGSIDNTERVAEGLRLKHPEVIKVFTKANGGHGSTINLGIEKATGKYFKIVDGDDWVDSGALRNLLDRLDHETVDLVIHNQICVYPDKMINTTAGDMPHDRVIQIEGINTDWYFGLSYITVKTEILKVNNVLIDENCYYVDQEYMLYTLSYVKTLKAYDISVYCYRLGNPNQSVAMENQIKHRNDTQRVCMSLLLFYINNKISTKNQIVNEYYLKWLFKVITRYYRQLMTNKEDFKTHMAELKSFDRVLRKEYSDLYKILRKRSKYVWCYNYLPTFVFNLYTLIFGGKQ